MTNRIPITALWVLFALAALGLPAIARGQPLEEGTGEISIGIRAESGSRSGSFGVGGVVRPGDWAGILLRISDSADKPREVMVRLTIPDVDGDRVHYERILTTNPGVPQPMWVFLRIPYRFSAGAQIVATAFTVVEKEAEAPPAGNEHRWTYGPGRVLGTSRIALTPNEISLRTYSMTGILGQRSMGLGRYQGDPGDEFMRGGHERMRLVSGLRPEDLPDRWMGLAPFETLVWADGQPAMLGTERAQALREWVTRGGHLVIVLPKLGQTWTDQVNNPLFDLVPRVRVERRENVDLEPYRVLIASKAEEVMPRDQILHTLQPMEDAGPMEAIPILQGPAVGGRPPECLVARRIVGTGMVTLIGLDVTSQAMTTANRDWPELELFWHRILGKRGEARRLTLDQRGQLGYQSRDPLTLDRDIRNEIAKTGLASGGVLIGFVVFVAYWLMAGPLGYTLLSRTGNKRHAWVAFVLAAGLFTAIAWGGARAIRPGSTETSHLTFIDHIYGQDVDRARSWVSLLVPDYGEAAVAVGDPALSSGRFVNPIAPWDGDDQTGEGFPDSRSYRIDARRPDLTVIPTRSTVKQFQIDWAGGPPWRMPRPLPSPGSDEGRLEVVAGPDGKPNIRGVLTHDLPGTLRDVYIVINFGQKDLARSFGGTGAVGMTSDAAAYLVSEWAPGDPLDLGRIEPVKDKLDTFKDLLSRAGPPDQQLSDSSPGKVGSRMTALALYSQLHTPSAAPAPNFTGRAEVVAQRRLTHGWDLGKWFTQPCIIVVGQLGQEKGEESPVPLYVSRGGAYRRIPQVGRTVVRWVYPLPARPPKAPTAETDQPAPDEREDGPPR